MHLSRLVVPDAGWRLTLYPSAGEAGGAFVPSYRPPRSGWVPGTPAADPERSRSEASRRARTRLRRYCAANRLTRLGTLTYAGSGVHDPVEVRQDVGCFFRSLRAALGGRAMPYAWVPEWHKTDHGLHLHFGLGQYVPYRLIKSVWGRGIVNIKLLSDLPVGYSDLAAARKASGYLSKYVTKSFADDELSRAQRLHRYDVAQGFQPQGVRFTGRWVAEVTDQAVAHMGGVVPAIAWSSADSDDWQGPPAVWFAWD